MASHRPNLLYMQQYLPTLTAGPKLSQLTSLQPAQVRGRHAQVSSVAIGVLLNLQQRCSKLQVAPATALIINHSLQHRRRTQISAELQSTAQHPPQSKPKRRVVITGMGCVTALGHEPEEFYNNLLQVFMYEFNIDPSSSHGFSKDAMTVVELFCDIKWLVWSCAMQHVTDIMQYTGQERNQQY